MPHAALWRDLHRVDVWELSAFSKKVPQFFGGENFSEIFDQRIRDGCTRSLAG
jgi:hypothetical protein